MIQEKAVQLHASWQAVLGDEFNKPYMQALRAFLSQEKAAGKIIYPPSPRRPRRADERSVILRMQFL